MLVTITVGTACCRSILYEGVTGLCHVGIGAYHLHQLQVLEARLGKIVDGMKSAPDAGGEVRAISETLSKIMAGPAAAEPPAKVVIGECLHTEEEWIHAGLEHIEIMLKMCSECGLQPDKCCELMGLLHGVSSMPAFVEVCCTSCNTDISSRFQCSLHPVFQELLCLKTTPADMHCGMLLSRCQLD
jgi:hypothetical protein